MSADRVWEPGRERGGAGDFGSWRRYLSGASVSAVGILLLGVPAYDIWDDATNLGWHLSTTLIENSVLVVLASVLIAGGIWLVRRAWPDRDVTVVGRWVVGGTVLIALVYAFVIYLQLWAMGRPKPYVLAADGVLMGAVAAFGAGIYDVQRRQRQRDLSTERNRFRSFFQRTEAGVVDIDRSGGDLSVRDVNEAFDSTFGGDFGDVLDAAERTSGDELDPGTVRQAIRNGESYRTEIRVPSTALTEAARRDDADEADLVDGRYYVLRLVHIPEGETFAVFPEVTAQKERERLLEAESERLEREKSERERELEQRTDQLEFLHSLLRHDVQNGMMVIDSRADVLTDELEGRQREFAETISSRTAEISDQIDRMRTALDALSSGTRESHPVDLTGMLTERVETFVASHPEADLTTDIDEGLVVQADDILEDVVANLLHNAVEHTDSDEPTVALTVHEVETGAGERVRVEVADDGPGIPEEDREAVFRRGVSTASGDGPGGSGFGLFFVDTMVDAYGGSVHVEDSELGGARLVVDLLPAEEGGDAFGET